MALQRPLWVLQYGSVAGIMSPLRIVQGGVSSPYPTNTNITHYNGNFAKLGCVHKGKPYIPTVSGWITFNSVINKWELTNRVNTASGIQASIASYFLYQRPSCFRWESPESTGGDNTVVAGGSATYDWTVHNNSIYATAPGIDNFVWSYPFNQAISALGVAPILVRVATHRGSVYGLNLSTSANSRLYKFEGGRWNVLGAAGFDITEKARISATASDRTSFFSWNGKLWMIIGYTNALATWCYRCWEVGLDGDTITENTNVIPAAFKVSPGAHIRYIWNYEDDAGLSRQVFIGTHARSSATLDVYEFDSEVAPWSLVANTGASVWTPPIMWDPTCKSCEIKSAQDSYPSEYVTAVHQVSDLNANGNVDIDIRYKDCADSTTDPPWVACTNKAGQGEGKTGLSSKPSGIALATDLTDIFDGTEVDWDKWEWSNQAIHWGVGDYGSVSELTSQKQSIVIQSNKLRLGGTAPAPVITSNHTGIGLRSKWLVGGDFSIDVDIDITNLSNSLATARYSLVFLAREAWDQIYGIRIWEDAGVYNSEGFTCSPGAVPSVKAVSVVVVDGDTFRISRTAGVWSLTHDPAGAANDLLPPVQPAYSNEVQFYLLLMTQSAANPADGTPGPGFDNFIVNSGVLGRYLNTVEHTFAWDHVIDEGSVVNKAFQLFSDTN